MNFIFRGLVGVCNVIRLVRDSFIFSLALNTTLGMDRVFLFPKGPKVCRLLVFFCPFFHSFFFVVFVL